MQRETASDLVAFLIVGREQSFTRAAARLGNSQSALSQIIRGLETRLGVRLLTRTTRRVSPTEAGERLLGTVGPRFEEVDNELAAVTELRDKPAGTIRLTSTEDAAETVLWPTLERFLPQYPDIKLEIIIDYGLTDIVAGRFDAGVRTGETVAAGMISVPIAADMRMAVVGAPAYFAQRKAPRVPQDLTTHSCINLRLPTHGGLYAWEFEKSWARGERPGRWSACVWNGFVHADGCARRFWPRLPDGTASAWGHSRRTARSCVGRLVSPFPRLSPLLSEPPPTYSRLHSTGRSTSLPPS